jgi:hypothetical protein
MLAHSVAALMIASILTAQAPVPNPQAVPADDPNASVPVAQSPAPAAGQNQTVPMAPNPAARSITLPAGTAIPLTLMTVIKSKSTKPGDSVRAVVAFPVTQGTQLAIPAGTYVEGVVNNVTAKPTSNQQPTMSAHFTRLVFSNGYSVPLNGENTQALLLPDTSAPSDEVAELLPLQMPGEHFAMGAGQETMPTLPQVGPPKGEVIGAVLGGSAAFMIGMLIWGHHRMNSYDYAVFDSGWQFQMVLDSPLTLDAAQVTAAAAMAPPSTN